MVEELWWCGQAAAESQTDRQTGREAGVFRYGRHHLYVSGRRLMPSQARSFTGPSWHGDASFSPGVQCYLVEESHSRRAPPVSQSAVGAATSTATPIPTLLVPTCQVCLSPYDPKDHRPLLLPACGHTFCAFCVDTLHNQGNRFCPKCRKDGALQPVSSLPVNYSLLDVAQANPDGVKVDAAVEPEPTRTGATNRPKKYQSLRRPTIATPYNSQAASTNSLLTNPLEYDFPTTNHLDSIQPFLQPGSLRTIHHTTPSRLQHQAHSTNILTPQTFQNLSVSPSTNHPTTPAHLQRRSRRTATRPSVRSNVSVPPSSTRSSAAHDSDDLLLSSLQKDQLDELDFQMAVHLTFCKDGSHDHDLHSSCSSWCWQNP